MGLPEQKKYAIYKIVVYVLSVLGVFVCTYVFSVNKGLKARSDKVSPEQATIKGFDSKSIKRMYNFIVSVFAFTFW